MAAPAHDLNFDKAGTGQLKKFHMRTIPRCAPSPTGAGLPSGCGGCGAPVASASAAATYAEDVILRRLRWNLDFEP